MLNNYKLDSNGVIKQIKINKISYDERYINNRYNTYNSGENMSFSRLGYLLGVLKDEKISSILDVGYGNGDFLKTASKYIEKCVGSDIPPMYPLPKHIKTVESIYDDNYDVICFFDSLEHFDDIYEIKNLNTKYVYISVPWCHNLSAEWFDNWKHRREDEHLWHFNLPSLTKFFASIGYELVGNSNIEDIIRTPYDENLPNILSAVFKKI
ncbi:class I SAM-dependent methyltransferase [Sulfurimonas sp.]|uniref:class I SAM-dependent methyltransferase n=1 Tax=Sulfurimonas sp. TaxID=2022749 RepID=UPI002AAF7625|nr:class I SAM-dependent methyltransferase [Sulfurimonas sp.]